MSEIIKIRMIRNVTPDTIAGLVFGNSTLIAREGVIYEAQTNRYGAISVMIEGQMLGIKPGEFEFVEAPSWVLEKHGKLADKYDSLVAEIERLTEKEEICDNCKNHPHNIVKVTARAEKAEAEVDRLQKLLDGIQEVRACDKRTVAKDE